MGDNCSPVQTRKRYHLYSTTLAVQSDKDLFLLRKGWNAMNLPRRTETIHMGIPKFCQGNQVLSDLWDTPNQGKGVTSSHLDLIKWYTFNTAMTAHQPSVWYLIVCMKDLQDCAWGFSPTLSPNVSMYYSTTAACPPACLTHLDLNPQFHVLTWFCPLISPADHVFGLNTDSPSDWFLTEAASSLWLHLGSTS